MSSTDPDRNKDSQPTSDKGENPFIKFKRFADSEISSILQGLIGLPSAFAKSSNNSSSQWSDLSDDLRRRDELLEKQRALKESEARKASVGHGDVQTRDERFDIPVKKFPGWQSYRSATDPDNTERITEPAGLERRAPLGWNGRAYGSNEERSSSSDERLPTLPSNSMGIIQALIYDTFCAPAVTKDLWNPERSFLPYILFSPYSPLLLSTRYPSAVQGFQVRTDDLTYCAAFEDLLLASQGRQMTKLSPLNSRESNQTSNPVRERSRPLSPDQNDLASQGQHGVLWINRLYKSGLLLNNQNHTGQSFSHNRSAPESCPKPIATGSPLSRAENHDHSHPDASEDADTEQDMYNRFLSSASAPSVTILEDIESIIADVGRFVFGQMRNLDEHCNKRSTTEQKSSATQTDDRPNEHRRPSATSTIPEREFSEDRVYGTHTRPESELQFMLLENLNRGRARLAKSEGSSLESVPTSEQTVSTTTSTEQTTMAGGIVKTTVTVEKRFADGRTSITETTQTESPSWRKDRYVWSDDDEDEWIRANSGKETPTDEKDNQEKKRGWFWN